MKAINTPESRLEKLEADKRKNLNERINSFGASINEYLSNKDKHSDINEANQNIIEAVEILAELRSYLPKETDPWAENEVSIICSDIEDEYAIACCNSAIRAYHSLYNDGHSGMSINTTKNVLNRLIDHLPLSEIKDTEDSWTELAMTGNLKESTGIIKDYQHKRYSSLFKHVYSDGSIKYSDVNRCLCRDINSQSDAAFTNGFISKVIDDIVPIEMPHYPSSTKIKVFVEEYLSDKTNGDFDTIGIKYAIVPGVGMIDINKYYKEDGTSMKEINNEEYNDRKKMSVVIKKIDEDKNAIKS